MRPAAATRIAGAALLLLAARDQPVGGRAFEGADPAPLVVGKRVWIYATGDGRTLRGWYSDDLRRWRRGPALLRRDAIGWIDQRQRRMLWAPHMVATGAGYFLYYSVGPQEPLASQIGVARCTTPAGPCRDSGAPLIDGRDSTARMPVRAAQRRCDVANPPSGSGRFGFEAIDPMVFIDPPSGRALLYAGGSNGATLRLFELRPDMVTVMRELPVDQPPCFTEGPWMHVQGGTYHLSYSQGRWNHADYSVHHATAPGPAGPWTYRGAILRSGQAAKGPGHHGFFNTPSGWYVAFHRWIGQRGSGPYVNGAREVVVRPVTHAPDGRILPVDPD